MDKQESREFKLSALEYEIDRQERLVAGEPEIPDPETEESLDGWAGGGFDIMCAASIRHTDDMEDPCSYCYMRDGLESSQFPAEDCGDYDTPKKRLAVLRELLDAICEGGRI